MLINPWLMSLVWLTHEIPPVPGVADAASEEDLAKPSMVDRRPTVVTSGADSLNGSLTGARPKQRYWVQSRCKWNNQRKSASESIRCS